MKLNLLYLRKSLKINSILLLLSFSFMLKAQFVFDTIPPLSIYQSIEDISVADFDNDMDDDMLIVARNESSLAGAYLFENDGSGGFTTTNLNFGSLVSGGTDWGDYDNDGDLDILLVARDFAEIWEEQVTRIYKNDGLGNFTEQSISLIGLEYSKCKWGDYDNDGDLDFIIAGQNSSGDLKTIIYRNDGDNTFVNINANLIGLKYISNLAWADLDNDNDLDFMINGTDVNFSTYTKVYINNGNDDFTVLDETFADGGPYPFDFNQDGNMDILVSGNNYENNGDGTFTEDLFSFGSYYSHYADFDNDGDIDAIASQFHGLKTYLNDGAGNLSQDQSFGALFRWVQFHKIDYNNDGKPDYIVDCQNDAYQTEFHVLRNTFAGTNNAPSVPTGLSSSLWGSDVTIKWDDAVDIQTDPATLSYNVMIGTTHDGIDILSPMADITNGNKYIPTYGNAWLKDSITIKGLEPDKTYYYKVQTVDNNFMTSAFSAEGSFYIPIFDEGLNPVFSQNFGNSQIKWADLDNDNDLDLLQTGIHDHQGGLTGDLTTILYINNGDDTFTEFEEGMKKVYEAGSDFADYDNDGDLDVLLFGRSNPSVNNPEKVTIVYKNNGDGTFTDIEAGLPGADSRYGNAQWGDINHDGLQDVLLMPGLDAEIYLNKGNDEFELAYSKYLTHWSDYYEWIDFNNDNEIDFIYANNDDEFHIFKNNGDLTFTEVISHGIDPINRAYREVVWWDYNNDGLLDVCAPFYNMISTNYEFSIYKNNGDETFTEILNDQSGDYNSTSPGDYDNDGDLDIIIGEHVYRNNGDDTFTAMSIALQPALSRAAWADFDNDHDLDFAMVTSSHNLGDDTNPSNLYRNNFLPNTKPQAPLNIRHEFISGSSKVILSWDRAYDKEQSDTANRSLTYNIRIGTTPGGYDILSPNADVSTGFRRIVEMGNALTDTFFYIQNLPEGRYYWAVQTIDNSFEGSVFSSESYFDVGLFTQDPQVLTYCTGDLISVPFDLNGMTVNSGNQFILQLSDPYGYFDVPTLIGDLTGMVSDTIKVNIPQGTKEGFKYKVRLLSTDPRIVGHENSSYITINSTPMPNISGMPFVCENAVAQVYSTYNYPNDTYLWSIAGGTITSANNNAQILVKWGSAGVGTISLLETNLLACSQTQSYTVTINANPSINLGTDKEFCLGLSELMDAGGGYNSYQWSSGETVRAINVTESGDYTVSVVDNNGCSGSSNTVNVNVLEPYNEEICLVSVDDETGKNMIIWEKTENERTISYNVFREDIIANNYEQIATLPYESLSVYVDSSSLPEKRSYKYKISTIDDCGNESEMSDYHKTMLLTSSLGQEGINLYWSEYSIGGLKFGFESYVIYRGADPSQMDSIDQIPSDNEMYPDFYSSSDPIYYYIAGVKPGAECDPANLLGKKANSGPFSRSLSNLEDNRLQSSSGIFGQVSALKVYPNPMSDFATISLPENGPCQLSIYDISGKTVKVENDISGNSIRIERGALSSGYYILEIKGERIYRSEIIVE